jgi:hypothetical protein
MRLAGVLFLLLLLGGCSGKPETSPEASKVEDPKPVKPAPGKIGFK